MTEPLTQSSSNRFVRLVEVSRILNSTTNTDELLNTIIREAANLTGSEAASILLLDRHTRQLRFKAATEISSEMIDVAVPLESSIAGAIFQSNKPLIINDVKQDPRWNPGVAQAINFQTRSILGVPMHDIHEPVGVLEAINKTSGAFTAEDVETLSILADLAGVAVEKARLIDELRAAYDELNELDQMKTGFIALASHELRTPLAIILGYISFLREEAAPEMASQLDSVLTAAVRLRTLIQDMLNFQYADVGQTRMLRKPIDLVEFVQQVLRDRQETPMIKHQKIAYRLSSTPVPVLIDPSMMEVVLNNLLNNAIKFTPDDGNIGVRVEKRGTEAWLTVSDDGVGIPPDKLERIFKRFYQVEHHLRRQHEGMGLGLAIAKDLVELHNGRIWAENRHPTGSHFRVALPLSPV